MKKVAVLGCGRLGRVIAEGLLTNAVTGADLVSIYVRSEEKASALRKVFPCPIVTSVDALLNAQPDYVIEAATYEAVQQYAIPIMEAGSDLIVLSTSAFGDPDFYQKVLASAEQYDRRIHLASGVIGGLDAIQAAAMMSPLNNLEITKRKFARGSKMSDAALDALDDSFLGTAEDARRLFPEQLNVAVSLGLAAGNLSTTKVVVAPSDRVDFTIRCDGAFGKAYFQTELGPSGPDFAAWSALALLQRLISRISF